LRLCQRQGRDRTKRRNGEEPSHNFILTPRTLEKKNSKACYSSTLRGSMKINMVERL